MKVPRFDPTILGIVAARVAQTKAARLWEKAERLVRFKLEM
jgi:hypothetical protein